MIKNSIAETVAAVSGDKTCPNCGAAIPSGVKFCGFCGTRND